MNELFSFFNGRVIAANEPVIGLNHPGLLYGDGLFETMRMHRGRILNWDYHFERLTEGCKVVMPELELNKDEQIISCLRIITKRFASEQCLRIRLTVFRPVSFSSPPSGNAVDIAIQVFSLAEPAFDRDGLKLMFYRDSFKGTGSLANIKSNNYQLHTMAQQSARRHGAGDAVLFNSLHRVCETTIANIFFIENGIIYTPALAEGCVAGTMRRKLIQDADKYGVCIEETTCTEERLLNAGEIFISNAIRWVQPVSALDNKKLTCKISRELFDHVRKSFDIE